MITVITPTVREQGLRLIKKALDQQTFKDWEWIVVSPEKPSIECTWVKDPGKNKGDYWSVYKAYNAAIRQAKGDLIVSWQDWTYVKPDTLERLWRYYEYEPETLVTGVGKKYFDDSWTIVTWKDPRERDDLGRFYETDYNNIEWNFCAVPKKAIYAVGGFDEELDKYSSLCGLDILARLDVIGGWKFKINQDIKTYSLEHGRLPGWEKNEPFNGPWQAKLHSYIANPVLKYLN